MSFEKRYAKGEDKEIIEKFKYLCKCKGWFVKSFGVEKLYPEKMRFELIKLTKTVNNKFARLERFRADFVVLKPNEGLFNYELKNCETIAKDAHEGYSELYQFLIIKNSPQLQNDEVFIVFYLERNYEFREVKFIELVLKPWIYPDKEWIKSHPNSSGKPYAYVDWEKTNFKVLN